MPLVGDGGDDSDDGDDGDDNDDGDNSDDNGDGEGGGEGVKKGEKNTPTPPKKNLDSPQIFLTAFFFIDKSRNLFKIVSVLLSALVERVGVSRMRDF